ncbi:MAG: hypothetical protein UW48_C0023G0007 [Microgenomates group bacterium GW2011_GWC1_44_23]|nr:MAG: hypothetical protein UW48_C0023G0007 [Microgenomates group bacterium GW2011_GWC1_44_23]
MNPSLYSPSDVGKIYSPRPEFIFEGTKNRTKTTAYEDKRKVALLTVDGQIDFVYPDGGLPVPGAIEDIRRLTGFIYRNLSEITNNYLSMDDHPPYAIFSPISTSKVAPGNPSLIPSGPLSTSKNWIHRPKNR